MWDILLDITTQMSHYMAILRLHKSVSVYIWWYRYPKLGVGQYWGIGKRKMTDRETDITLYWSLMEASQRNRQMSISDITAFHWHTQSLNISTNCFPVLRRNRFPLWWSEWRGGVSPLERHQQLPSGQTLDPDFLLWPSPAGVGAESLEGPQGEWEKCNGAVCQKSRGMLSQLQEVNDLILFTTSVTTSCLFAGQQSGVSGEVPQWRQLRRRWLPQLRLLPCVLNPTNREAAWQFGFCSLHYCNLSYVRSGHWQPLCCCVLHVKKPLLLPCQTTTIRKNFGNLEMYALRGRQRFQRGWGCRKGLFWQVHN